MQRVGTPTSTSQVPKFYEHREIDLGEDFSIVDAFPLFRPRTTAAIEVAHVAAQVLRAHREGRLFCRPDSRS
jgi:hypothetical protein